MKTRQGFVSNSSSSSFIIFGAYIEDEIEWEDRETLEDAGISYHESEGGICVGIDTDDMGLDETLRQFQMRIAEQINKVGVVKVEPAKCKFIGGEEHD